MSLQKNKAQKYGVTDIANSNTKVYKGYMTTDEYISFNVQKTKKNTQIVRLVEIATKTQKTISVCLNVYATFGLISN